MTLEEITPPYPQPWVLIALAALDEHLDPVDGTVMAQAAAHDRMLAV